MTFRWYAKRFLHPDIVAAYEYIFIWDEDLGVDHFNGDEYAFFYLHLTFLHIILDDLLTCFTLQVH
jgi:hypothetical protein